MRLNLHRLALTFAAVAMAGFVVLTGWVAFGKLSEASYLVANGVLTPLFLGALMVHHPDDPR